MTVIAVLSLFERDAEFKIFHVFVKTVWAYFNMFTELTRFVDLIQSMKNTLIQN